MQLKKEPPSKLFDLLVSYSNAHDLYSFGVLLHDEQKFSRDEEVVKLKVMMTQLADIISNAILRLLIKRCIETAQAIEQKGLGNVLRYAVTIQDNVKKLHDTLNDRLQSRNFLKDSTLGYNLIQSAWTKYKDFFIEHMNAELKNNPKLPEGNRKQIEDLLLDFRSDDCFFNLELDMSLEYRNLMVAFFAVTEKIAEKYNLKTVNLLCAGFEEALAKNAGITSVMLTSNEQTHLASLLSNMPQGSISHEEEVEEAIVISKAVAGVGLIAPVYNVEIGDCQSFLNEEYLTSKWSYFARQFAKAGAQIYRTFEGLALSTNAQLILQKRLSKLESFAETKGKKELAGLIRSYIMRIEQHYQVSLRLVMPLEGMQKNCETLQSLLAKSCPDFANTRAGKVLKSLNETLTSCTEILRLKGRSSNALVDISEFNSKLTQLLKAPAKPAAGYLSAWWSPPSQDYSPLLQAIKSYFIHISQSGHNEQHTNFKGIVEKLKSLFQEHKIDYDALKKKDVNQATAEEKLLKGIIERYDSNVEKLQQDVPKTP